MVVRSIISGCGGYLPDRVVTNEELARRLDTSDEWIRTRTGIHERRIADEGESTSTLAIQAGKMALGSAKILPSELDLIILATTTPAKFTGPEILFASIS